MKLKKLATASIAVFIALEIMDFVVHNIILMPSYLATSGIWRQDMGSRMWIMVLSALFTSILFVYIFAKGYENKGIMEGARFGLLIGLFMTIMGSFGTYSFLPIPFSLAVKWFVFGMIEYIICGIVVALVYRDKSIW
jgi:hypothetical protein